MTVHFQSPGATILHGDCIEEMRTLADGSVHAVVTDPPYGLEFMGKEWDRFSPLDFELWCAKWAAECLRILKPGGHLLAFGGTRTWHRLAAGVENAGFEMRDSIAWLYGSGFPKSLDVSKGIDRAAGAEREVVGTLRTNVPMQGGNFANGGASGEVPVTRAATDDARTWEGWGTALKPSFEPIVVARKPLIGTVVANVLLHGTGAMNINANRVSMNPADREAAQVPMRSASPAKAGTPAPRAADVFSPADAGRWPTNVLLDESQALSLDGQSGTLSSGTMRAGQNREPRTGGTIFGADGRKFNPADTYGDSGGASRFFPTFRYEAKASSSERPLVDGIQHPTVKPLDLMRWLVRLVTPPGGTVLEPFAGSGTTVEACLREGFQCIAIEREVDYLPLILSRVRKDHQQSLFGDWEEGHSA